MFAFVFMLSIHLSICLRLLRICSAVCLVVMCSCLLLLNYWLCLCFSCTAPPVLTAKLVNRVLGGEGRGPTSRNPSPSCCLKRISAANITRTASWLAGWHILRPSLLHGKHNPTIAQRVRRANITQGFRPPGTSPSQPKPIS